jgi:LPS export ABC transporter permease LptF
MLKRLVPKKIDIYLLTEMAGPLLGGVIFFSFILLMFQALRLAESLIVHGVPGAILGKMVSLMVLGFLPIVIPIAFLIAILVAFGRLSADSELVAMKANGMSIQRLTVPGLVLSFCVAIISLGLNLTWVPKADREFKRTLIRLTNTKAVAAVREGTFTTGFFDLLIYADKVDNKTNRLEKVFIYDERDPETPLTVIAGEGEVIPVKAGADLGTSVALKLYDGSIHSNNVTKNTYQKMDFKEYQLFLRVEAGADTATIKPRMIPYRELLERIRTEKEAKYRREFIGDLWRRVANAMAPIFFVFIGVGFGTVRTRAVRSGAALITIAVIVPYWLLQTLSTKLVYSGILPPMIGMMLPNFLLGIIAWRGYRTATW